MWWSTLIWRRDKTVRHGEWTRCIYTPTITLWPGNYPTAVFLALLQVIQLLAAGRNHQFCHSSTSLLHQRPPGHILLYVLSKFGRINDLYIQMLQGGHKNVLQKWQLQEVPVDTFISKLTVAWEKSDGPDWEEVEELLRTNVLNWPLCRLQAGWTSHRSLQLCGEAPRQRPTWSLRIPARTRCFHRWTRISGRFERLLDILKSGWEKIRLLLQHCSWKICQQRASPPPPCSKIELYFSYFHCAVIFPVLGWVCDQATDCKRSSGSPQKVWRFSACEGKSNSIFHCDVMLNYLRLEGSFSLDIFCTVTSLCVFPLRTISSLRKKPDETLNPLNKYCVTPEQCTPTLSPV